MKVCESVTLTNYFFYLAVYIASICEILKREEKGFRRGISHSNFYFGCFAKNPSPLKLSTN
jgi:hypothetical protein